MFSRQKSNFRSLVLVSTAAWLMSVGACFAQNAAVPDAPTRKFDYVGACISTAPRLEAIPGRVYLDFAGQPTDPIVLMQRNGFNAWRLFSSYHETPESGAPLIADNIAKDGRDLNGREENFALDFDRPSSRLALAKRVHVDGAKILLTLQFGQDGSVDNWHEYIPKSWLGLNYVQTLDKIDGATRAMLRSYLEAGVQPDVIIVENEADSGMLFQYLGDDGKMHIRDTKTNPNDDTAGGHYQNFPKYAGYFKREILSARDEIKKVGFDPAKTRFAFHSTTNPFRNRSAWERTFENKPDADRMNYDDKGHTLGLNTAVPVAVRDVKLSDLVDILGFSYYPPEFKDDSPASIDASLKQFTDDLTYFNERIPRFGRYESGPFKGQPKKQALVVESAAKNGAIVPPFFAAMSPYDWMMGTLWWEPTYGSNNWYGSQGSLFRRTVFEEKTHTWAQLKPVPWLQTWGSYAKQ